MSLSTQTASGAVAAEKPVVDLRGMWIGLALLNSFYLLVRVYEQIYGWRAGLDSFAPEFQTYWMSILWSEIPLELVSGLALAGYLWKTRVRDMSTVTPRQEMRAIVDNVKWLVVYSAAIYWGASFFTEQDGTWHMTVIRDTDFTPVPHHRILHELSDLFGAGDRLLLSRQDAHSLLLEGLFARLSDRVDRPLHDHPECGPQRVGPYVLVHGRTLRRAAALGLRCSSAGWRSASLASSCSFC